jgi:Protein of unknown function (DUF2817)
MNYFSTDYFTARSKFIAATNLHNGRLKSYQIDAEIPLADDLTIDVAIFGHLDASKAVVISSGLHGVEGLFGSAVQLATIVREASALCGIDI